MSRISASLITRQLLETTSDVNLDRNDCVRVSVFVTCQFNEHLL